MTGLSELTRRWIGTPYEGLTCLSFARQFLAEATGKPIPDDFDGLSLDEHYQRWRVEPRAAERVLCDAVIELTELSNPARPRVLDLLVVDVRGRGLTPAVYVGNGNAIAAFIRPGVQVFNLDKNNRVILAGSI